MTSPSAHAELAETNQAELLACFGRIKRRLAAHAGGSPGASPPASPVYDCRLALSQGVRRRWTGSPRRSASRPSSAIRCCSAPASSWTPSCRALCAAAQGRPRRARTRPSAWRWRRCRSRTGRRCRPMRPLRRLAADRSGRRPVLTRAPLRIDERVLHFLVGVDATRRAPVDADRSAADDRAERAGALAGGDRRASGGGLGGRRPRTRAAGGAALRHRRRLPPDRRRGRRAAGLARRQPARRAPAHRAGRPRQPAAALGARGGALRARRAAGRRATTSRLAEGERGPQPRGGARAAARAGRRAR